ncbi:MAG: Gfo/Idh/MocA family oxidoreductase [Planctomycetes bacterium]|nr:Gfo/Idh/MocA family oxidoreductase [Planctomycetota bacterium]
MTSPEVRVAVVGVGHLGREHARVYASLPGVRLVAVTDRDMDRARTVAQRFGCRAVGDPAELRGEVDAASVATPTSSHLEVAVPLLASGLHLLVEKPLALDLGQARELVEAAARAGRLLAVGHVERFNPAVSAVRRLIDSPRYIECDRISPYSFRSSDIGVVLDLMIHDLDIVLSLVERPVERVEAVGAPVISPTEDVANARLVFQGGCVANITASRVALKRERKIRLFQRDAYVTLDYLARKALVYRRRNGVELDQDVIDKVLRDGEDAVEHLLRFVEVQEVAMAGQEPLVAELESFVDSVRRGERPRVSGEDGVQAMAVAERVVADIRRNMAPATA